MPTPPPSPKVVCFGIFEADLAAGELRKRGRKVELQDQPFHVLALLLQRPKEIVTREELRQALWSDDTFVEFDESLNKAVQKLRQALGDSADNPHFVETLPRKGYRFIASVETALIPVPVPVPASNSHWLWILAAAAGFVAVSLAVGWLLRSPHKPSEAVLVPVPLTSYPGEEEYPSFSPDGTQVAFQRCPEGLTSGKNCDIYVKQIGVEPPSRLTDTPAQEFSPTWSPDGQTIAFLRRLSRDASSFSLVLIPQRGGRERMMAELDFSGLTMKFPDGPYLAWTPDAKWLACPLPEAGQLALYLFSVETGEKRKLTSPPAEPSADTAPAFSPDGRTLAFARLLWVGPRAQFYLLRLGEGYQPLGEPQRARLDPTESFSPAWTPDGKEIVFASSAGLWRMTAFKPTTPRRLPFAQDNAFAPAVSRQGNRVAYSVARSDTNIWRIDLGERNHEPSAPVPFISSTWWEADPAYSPDGKRIAFVSNRSGGREIWVCDADGSNAVQLTSLGGPAIQGSSFWSPDGQNMAFSWEPGGNQDVYVVSAAGGVPRRVTAEPAADKWPYWSRDGQWLYFCSLRTGKPGQIWKMPSSGGEAVQITRNGGDVPQESADGKFVYYEKGWPSQCSVWRIPVEGGEETKVLDSVHPYGSWAVGRDGIYFFTVPYKNGHSDLTMYEFATGKTRKILTIETTIDYRIAVSPDGRTILYTQQDEAGSDLMLVENFR